MTQLQHVHDKLQDEYENAIMEKYGYIGKRLTIALISKTKFLYSTTFLHSIIALFTNVYAKSYSRRPINPNPNNNNLYTYEWYTDSIKIHVVYYNTVLKDR